jgi:hypothetical protein
VVAIQVVTLRFPVPRTPATVYIKTEEQLSPMETLRAIGEEVDKLFGRWLEWSHWTWDGTFAATPVDDTAAFS